MQFCRCRFSVLVALALGWVIGGFNASSPTAVAQVARITLESLQRQITRIVDGDTSVGHAVEAAHATTADDSQHLNGRPAADFALTTDVNAALGNVFTTAGAGLTANAGVVGIDFNALDAEYLPLAGGTVTGALNAAGGIQLPVSAGGSTASSTGMLRYNSGTGKLEVSNGSTWVPVH